MLESLTIIVTHYRRPANVERLLAALDRQTLAHQRWLWDNSGSGATFSTAVDRRVDASCNFGCSPRWWLAAQAPTPYVMVIDDDLVPTDDSVLADLVAWLAANDGKPCGLVGVELQPGVAYRHCPWVGHGKKRTTLTADLQVDILKGRLIAAATPRLARLPAGLPRFEDDIAVSSHLGPGTVLAMLQGRFSDLPQGRESVCRRPGHFAAREDARRRWFDK